jgi:son of sevenless-like protein
MCLLESDLFGSLQIKEFFNQGWNKGSNEQKDLAAPNIRLMIKVSNQIITWIAFEILRQPSASARSKAIGKAIQLAILLNEKNNFNGVKEITAGLCLSSIQRLKKAWSTVKPKFKQAYNDLCDKVANMQSLRNLPHSVNPPLVPYLGVYLTDLVFIEDGNPNTFEEDGSTFINFRKMSIMGEVLMEISSYQQERYGFLKIDDLYNYLLMMEAHSDNELHQLSQTAEPKKR